MEGSSFFHIDLFVWGFFQGKGSRHELRLYGRGKDFLMSILMWNISRDTWQINWSPIWVYNKKNIFGVQWLCLQGNWSSWLIVYYLKVTQYMDIWKTWTRLKNYMILLIFIRLNGCFPSHSIPKKWSELFNTKKNLHIKYYHIKFHS